LLEDIQAAGVAFHAGATPAAWRNSLFLASPDQECLYRVAGLSSSRPEPAVERLLANSFGRIVAVLSGDDGLYFATGNGGVDDRGRPADAVFRIRDMELRIDSPGRRER
jgi:glucose/arabinose dehydrogenase